MKSIMKKFALSTLAVLAMTGSQVAVADVVYDINQNVFTGDVNSTEEVLFAFGDDGVVKYIFNLVSADIVFDVIDVDQNFYQNTYDSAKAREDGYSDSRYVIDAATYALSRNSIEDFVDADKGLGITMASMFGCDVGCRMHTASQYYYHELKIVSEGLMRNYRTSRASMGDFLPDRGFMVSDANLRASNTELTSFIGSYKSESSNSNSLGGSSEAANVSAPLLGALGMSAMGFGFMRRSKR